MQRDVPQRGVIVLSPSRPIIVPLLPLSRNRYLRLTFASKDLDGDPVRAVKYVECCNDRLGAGMHWFLTVQVHRSIGHSFTIAAIRVRDFSNRQRSRIISALLGNLRWSCYPCDKSHCGFLFYYILAFATWIALNQSEIRMINGSYRRAVWKKRSKFWRNYRTRGTALSVWKVFRPTRRGPFCFRSLACLMKKHRYWYVSATCTVIKLLVPLIENAARSFLCLPDITTPLCCARQANALSDLMATPKHSADVSLIDRERGL